MDSFRHRVNPRFGEPSSDLLEASSILQKPVRQDKHSAEMINMNKIDIRSTRRSSSLNQNRSRIRWQLTRQNYHTASLMSHRNLSEFKIESPDIQLDSSPLKNDSSDETHHGERRSIITQTV